MIVANPANIAWNGSVPPDRDEADGSPWTSFLLTCGVPASSAAGALLPSTSGKGSWASCVDINKCVEWYTCCVSLKAFYFPQEELRHEKMPPPPLVFLPFLFFFLARSVKKSVGSVRNNYYLKIYLHNWLGVPRRATRV